MATQFFLSPLTKSKMSTGSWLNWNQGIPKCVIFVKIKKKRKVNVRTECWERKLASRFSGSLSNITVDSSLSNLNLNLWLKFLRSNDHQTMVQETKSQNKSGVVKKETNNNERLQRRSQRDWGGAGRLKTSRLKVNRMLAYRPADASSQLEHLYSSAAHRMHVFGERV